MTTWEFSTSGPIEAQLSVPAGTVSVTATPTQAVTVSLLPHREGDDGAERLTGQVSLSTASGDVRLGDAAADVRVNTASGDVSIERVGGDLTAKTASGDLGVGEAGRSAEVKTASGDVRIRSITSGRADVASVSGHVTLAVPPGTAVYLDLSSLSGRVRSELDSSADPGDGGGDPDLILRCNTVSGDIQITRAVPAA